MRALTSTTLGGPLYESLTGEVPYPRDRKLQVLFAHVNDPSPKPTEVRPGLPEPIDGVIARAMAKEAEDRYATAAELANAAVAAFPEARRPWWQLAALVGILALLIAAASPFRRFCSQVGRARQSPWEPPRSRPLRCSESKHSTPPRELSIRPCSSRVSPLLVNLGKESSPWTPMDSGFPNLTRGQDSRRMRASRPGHRIRLQAPQSRSP